MNSGAREKIRLLKETVARHFVGKSETINQILISIFSGGHALMVGVPGVGKTYLVNIIARAMALDFRRIQFTPDTQPSDVTGTWIWNFKDAEYMFVPGPIFTNLLLADEVNRTSPRVKASMLGPMQEELVPTIFDIRRIPQPFTVLATMNPIEQHGTELLGAAELDRYMLYLRMEWASEEELEEILRLSRSRKKGEIRTEEIEPVMTAEDVLQIRSDLFATVKVGPEIEAFISRFINFSRRPQDYGRTDLAEDIILGASDRAGEMLIYAAMAHAFLHDRNQVAFQDVSKVINPVLMHRLIFRTASDDLEKEEIINRLKSAVPVLG